MIPSIWAGMLLLSWKPNLISEWVFRRQAISASKVTPIFLNFTGRLRGVRGRGCTSAGQDVEPYSVVELYPIAAHQWNFCCVLIELQPVRFNSGRNVTDYIWEDEPSPSLSSATDTYSWVWSALRHCFFFLHKLFCQNDQCQYPQLTFTTCCLVYLMNVCITNGHL